MNDLLDKFYRYLRVPKKDRPLLLHLLEVNSKPYLKR